MKTNYLFKTLLVLMLLMNSFVIFAQTDEIVIMPHLPPRPGDALISFTRIYYTGFALQVVGVGFIVLAQTAMNDEDEGTIKPMSYVGGALALGGIIVQIVSFSSIGKAGKQMNELERLKNRNISINIEPTQFGIGIVCRF